MSVWSKAALRGGSSILSVTTTADATPELSRRADCVAVSITADAANTAVCYLTFDGRVPTANDHDTTIAANGVIESDGIPEARVMTVRALAASGTQTLRILPRYQG